MLRARAADETAAAADILFSKLAGLARRYAPRGAAVTKQALERDLSGMPLARSPSYPRPRTAPDWPTARASGTQRVPTLDTSVPNSARVWNYWLGGNDNFSVNRMAGECFQKVFPDIAVIARATQAFQGRAVEYLAGEAQVRQFLDIGVGYPTANSTHEVAQRVVPKSRIAYVDYDPVVVVHARALLDGHPLGNVDHLELDLREPEKVVRHAARTLDVTQPVAVLLLPILGHITDDDQAQSIVTRLLDSLPSGSYLVLSDGTNVINGPAAEAAQRAYNDSGAEPYCLRSPEQLVGFLRGLALVEPGLVSCPRWRPEPGYSSLPAAVDAFCAAGRKP